MNTTKRQSDPLGRSPILYRYSRRALCLAIALTGSVWPIRARSIEAIFDTSTLEQERWACSGGVPVAAFRSLSLMLLAGHQLWGRIL